MDLGIWGALPCFGFSLGVLVLKSTVSLKGGRTTTSEVSHSAPSASDAVLQVQYPQYRGCGCYASMDVGSGYYRSAVTASFILAAPSNDDAWCGGAL